MTNPNEVTELRALTGAGQINVGDKVQFTLGDEGAVICATAAMILFPGTSKEEVVYNRQKNHYFITSRVLDGTSSHKSVMVKPSTLTLALEQSWNTRTSATSDAARLDWLQSQCEAYGFQDMHEGNRWTIDGPFMFVREAIDAAIAAGGSQNG